MMVLKESPLLSELSRLKDGESKIISLNGLKVFNCQKSHFVDKGFPHYFFIIEELTEEIFQREKRAYEKVIRMMSHEVNNSIGAINSILNSCLIFNSNRMKDEVNEYTTALEVAINRNQG